MDHTVISPAPGQSVITTDDGHHDRHHGHHGGHHLDSVILREQLASYRTASQDRNDIVGAVTSSAMAGALASCKTDDAICSATSTLRHDICDLGSAVAASAKDTAVGFKDQLVTAYQIESRSLLEAAKNAAAVQVQADKNFYASSLEAVKFASAASVEATKNANAATLQAQTIASAATLQAQVIASEAAAKAAECCCKLEALVLAQAEATRAAITASDMQRLRDENLKLVTQNSAYFARNLAPVIPVSI